MKLLIIGAGPMAADYAKVLVGLKQGFSVVGNSEKSAQTFTSITGRNVTLGGIKNWLEANSTEVFEAYKVIIAVNEHLLGHIAVMLIEAGFKDILLEKPGGLDSKDIRKVAQLAEVFGSRVYIAYNRRFFSSTLQVKELIEKDGGVTSFNFEFTEWAHIVRDLTKEKVVLEEWLLQNSSHVIDLAFHVGGVPSEMKSFVQGGEAWHPSGVIYSGAGRTTKNALFSYNANWQSAGRWWIEFLTAENRFLMKPMEKLFIQARGTVSEKEVDLNCEFDLKYKPGLYRQVEKFLFDQRDLLTISEQVENLAIYDQIKKGDSY